MKNISWSYILGGILILHSVTGAILTFVQNPFGTDLQQCFAEAVAGAGIIRSRKATKVLEKKVEHDLE